MSLLGFASIGQLAIAQLPPASPTILRAAFLSKPFQIPPGREEVSKGLNLSLFTNPIPFAQFDWSKPTRIAPPPPQPLQINLSLSFPPLPFAQYDWSKPAAPIYGSTLTLPLNINLFTNPIPFGPYDYSRGPTPVPQARRDLSQSLNLQLFTNQVPFMQLDWSRATRVAPPMRGISGDFKNLPLTGGTTIHANPFFATMGLRPL